MQGFTLTNENYNKNTELLTERFGWIDKVINSRINKLLNIEPVENAWNVKSFLNLYDHPEINIRSLECLNVDTKSVAHF